MEKTEEFLADKYMVDVTQKFLRICQYYGIRDGVTISINNGVVEVSVAENSLPQRALAIGNPTMNLKK